LLRIKHLLSSIICRGVFRNPLWGTHGAHVSKGQESGRRQVRQKHRPCAPRRQRLWLGGEWSQRSGISHRLASLMSLHPFSDSILRCASCISMARGCIWVRITLSKGLPRKWKIGGEHTLFPVHLPA